MPVAGEVVRRRVRAVKIAVRAVKTPIGTVRVAASYDHVLYLELPRRRGEGTPGPPLDDHVMMRGDTPALRSAVVQLQEYFAGTRRRFDVPLDPAGTAFQHRVWNRVLAIPYGATSSFGRVATDVGGPALARAVGAAIGANPIPIVIPCHRVLGSDGALVGYGGGLRMKVWLLRHEGVLLT